ncbi:MAG: DUF3108 domain-containing protein [Candidatus Omnitrophica bacterium]|nr:DUF3108 domain-containing protein [Candidatus Omnitrophota bacterium]MBU4458051.1 DUF3108 domain-containing protein [Candidatus Omnitrophota bacterium]
MQKRKVFSLIIFFCLVICIDKIFALPFEEGEQLTYQVSFKQVKLGKSIMTFRGEEDINGESAYRISFFTKIPSLKDTEELYAAKDTFLPIEVHRKVKKRIGFSDNIIEKYDQENFRVDITSKSRLRTKEFSIEKDSPIHNAILLVYYCRTIERFDKNKPIKINLPTTEFDVLYKGIETIDTPIGEFQAHSFTSNPPKFKLWLSADDRRIPLKIKNPGTLGYTLVIKSIE